MEYFISVNQLSDSNFTNDAVDEITRFIKGIVEMVHFYNSSKNIKALKESLDENYAASMKIGKYSTYLVDEMIIYSHTFLADLTAENLLLMKFNKPVIIIDKERIQINKPKSLEFIFSEKIKVE